MHDVTGPEPVQDAAGTTSAGSLPGSLVEAASGALAGAPTVAGAHLLPRVLGDAPIAVLVVDRTVGHVTFANDAALQLAGDVALPVPTDAWSAAAGVTDIDGAPLAVTTEPLSRIAAGEPVAGEPVRIRGAAGVAASRGTTDERGPVVWATGFPLGTDGSGDQLALLVFLPVEQPDGNTDPEMALQSLRERAVVATELCFTISDPRQPGNPLVWVNPSFTRVTGYPASQAVGRNCKFLQGPATDPTAVTKIVTDLSAGRSTAVTLLNYRLDGTAFWNHVSISPVHDGTGTLVSFVGVQSDVTARVAADRERDLAHTAERAARQAAETAQRTAEAARAEAEHARTEAENARAAAEAAQARAEVARTRMTLMAGATTELIDSLDPQDLLGRLATLCVPLLADWALIVAVDEGGVVTSIASRHRSGPAVDPLLQQVHRQYHGRTLPPDSPSATAMTSGHPVSVDHLTPDSLSSYVRGLNETTVLDQLGTGSVLAVPLTSSRGTWGAMALVRANPQGFDGDDQDVAADLGRRAGQALANARSYTTQASVAEALQRALLPDLPALPGVTAAAHYAAASTSAAVGGDFYDLLPLPDQRIGIVIGDVAGHDITAAAAMGQLRGLIRSEAWNLDTPTPDTVLTRVDRLLGVLGLPVIATGVLLRVTPPSTTPETPPPGLDAAPALPVQGNPSPPTHQPAPAQPPHLTQWLVECSNAGHPPVLARTPDGHVEALCTEHGLLLGTGMAHLLPSRVSTPRALPAGSQLMLFTDGLIEQPEPGHSGPQRDQDAGIARLQELWEQMPPSATPDDVVSAVDALVTSPDDDVAILVLQLGPTP